MGNIILKMLCPPKLFPSSFSSSVYILQSRRKYLGIVTRTKSPLLSLLLDKIRPLSHILPLKNQVLFICFA